MSDYQDLLTVHRTVMRAVNDLIKASLDNTVMWELSERGPDQVVSFLEWLPDMIKHQEAERIRQWTKERPPNDFCRKAAARRMADMIDPLCVERDSSGTPSWYRKRDHRLVPVTVMHDPDPKLYPDKQKEERS